MKALLKALIIRGLVQFGISTGRKAKTAKYIFPRIAAGFLFLIAIIFALIALHQILRHEFSLPIVNLIFAAGFALVALIIRGVVAAKRAKQQNTSTFEASLRTLEDFGDRAQVQAKQLGGKAERYIRRKPSKTLIGVALISLFLGWKSGR